MLSILIPAFNAGRFVREAILSAARQTTKIPVEILVCDDGSTDNTLETLHNLKNTLLNLRVVLHSENKGVSATRNMLMTHLNPRTEFVTFFDADDVYLEGALDTSLAQFSIKPETKFTRGKTQFVPSAIIERGGTVGGEWPTLHAVTLSSSVMRADFLAKIGKFNEALDFGEDFDFLLRMAEVTPHRAFHDDVIFYYRRHKRNVTADVLKLRRGAMRAMLLHAKRKAANPNLHDVSDILPSIDPEIMRRALALADEH